MSGAGVAAVEGNCSVLHVGCSPLTITFAWLLLGADVPDAVLPLPGLLPGLPALLAVGLSVGVTCSELLPAAMVGVLVICQLDAPSEVRPGLQLCNRSIQHLTSRESRYS